MFVITLGTIASGSTWVFNVVRAICAEMLPDAVSLSAAEASTLLSNIGPGSRDIILKSHHLDAPMLAFAAVCRAKTIVTIRDPRDSLVSQRERFGAGLRDAVRDLSRSSATFAMMEDNAPTLVLRYEDRFTENPETVEQIAAFLELPIGPALVRRIFEAHRAENVTRALDRSNGAGRLRAFGFDIATHWHANHVGDQQIGKWHTRLNADDQHAVVGAVGSALEQISSPRRFAWSPKLFTFHDDRSGEAEETLDCEGEERPLGWGPYLYLPAGRWQIRPRIELDGPPLSIRIDTHIPAAGRDVLAQRLVNLPTSSPERLVMEFDHHDHLEAIEMRIGTINDGRRGRIRFSGAELERLGPSERANTILAQPVR